VCSKLPRFDHQMAGHIWQTAVDNQRVLYNKTRDSVDAYADMLFDLQPQPQESGCQMISYYLIIPYYLGCIFKIWQLDLFQGLCVSKSLFYSIADFLIFW